MNIYILSISETKFYKLVSFKETSIILTKINFHTHTFQLWFCDIYNKLVLY